jgi:hypothetical protein
MNADFDFLKECAYESALDDYESLATLLEELDSWLHDSGRAPVEKQDFIGALKTLVEEGKIGVYEVVPQSSTFAPVQFDTARIGELWFRSRQSP